MPSATKPFTDKQKAEIFVRDRATCCFSGANLWLLDAPLRHGWESDWVDHIRPMSRGGKSDPLENGVCASATFNMKKRNNSADTTYLFRSGHPTSLYYKLHGPPPTAMVERLQRLANLKVPDWYFNRSINWVLQALHYKCWSKHWDKLPTRDDKYWFGAAFKKLQTFQKLADSCESLEERGIVCSPSELQQILLSLRETDSLDDFTKRSLKIFPTFKINSEAWDEYFNPEEYVESECDCEEECESQRKKAYQNAVAIRDQLTGDTFHCIESDYKIRYVPA